MTTTSQITDSTESLAGLAADCLKQTLRRTDRGTERRGLAGAGLLEHQVGGIGTSRQIFQAGAQIADVLRGSLGGIVLRAESGVPL